MENALFVFICVPAVPIYNPALKHVGSQGSAEQALKLSWSLLNTTFYFLNIGHYKMSVCTSWRRVCSRHIAPLIFEVTLGGIGCSANDPAALPQEKVLRVALELEYTWAIEPVWTRWTRDRSLDSAWNRTSFTRTSSHRVVTMLANICHLVFAIQFWKQILIVCKQ